MSLFGEILADKTLAYWRFHDVAESVANMRRNLALNPSVENDSLSWQTAVTGASSQTFPGAAGGPSSHFTGARVAPGATEAKAGTALYRGTATVNYDNWCWVWTGETTVRTDKGYTVSVWVRPSRASIMTIYVDFIDAAERFFANSGGVKTSVPANTWARLPRVVTPPRDTVRTRGSVGLSKIRTGDTLDVDAVMYEEGGDLNPYFDGSFTAGIVAPDSVVWEGSPHNSISRYTWYTARRRLTDYIGAYHGTFTDSVSTAQAGRVADAGNVAMKFTGAGSSATVPASGSVWDLGTEAKDQWSIEMLVRFDGSSGEVIARTDKWKIAAFGTSVSFAPVAASSAVNSCPGARATGWRHLVATFDGAVLRWYLNGALAATIASPAVIAADSSGALVLGNTAVSLDEFAVYPVVLSAARVQRHYDHLDIADNRSVTGILVSPTLASLSIGGAAPQLTQQLTAELTYSDGTTAPASPGSVTWSISDSGVASVSAAGLLTAVEDGIAGVTASISGVPSRGISQVAVRRIRAPIDLDPDPAFSLDPTFPVYDSLGRFVATTGEYWEVDPGRFVRGQWVYDRPFVLNTYGWNITSLDGREGIPLADGENIRISSRSGREWVPKSPDERTLSLAMWVQGSEVDGSPPRELALRTQFQENYNNLKKLFAVWDRMILVRRRVATRAGIVVQEAFVEPKSDMNISMTGPMRGAFTIDLGMPDPFWYDAGMRSSGPVVVRAFAGARAYPRTYPLTYGSSGETGVFVLDNIGTHDAKLIGTFRGPLTNPSVSNIETGEFFRLVPDVEIDDNTQIEVDFHERTIKLDGTGSRYWWLDRSSDWLVARPGKQTLQFSHDGGERTGIVTWQWKPSYL